MSAEGETTKNSRAREYELIAGVLSVSGLVIAALAFLTPQAVGNYNMGMGTTTTTAYTTLNMLMALVGGFLFAAGAAFVLFNRMDEGRPEVQRAHEAVTIVPAPPPPQATMDESVEDAVHPETESEGVERSSSVQEIVPELAAGAKEGHLVLRLLSGDERTVFRSIMEAGGEIFQKDIVLKTKMSDAKVSRVLDKLEEKGLVTKERHGMSNKVRIDIEE